MIPTVEYLEERFEVFNKQIFAGTLPKIPIALSKAKGYFGSFQYKTRNIKWGKTENYDYIIRISTCVEFEEKELEDILIHEMMHYFIKFHNIKDNGHHGDEFKMMMQEINEQHGRNIKAKAKLTDEQRDQMYGDKRVWRVVAICRADDFEPWVKVMKYDMTRVMELCKQMDKSSYIYNYDLFLTDDPFFNRFPVSFAFTFIKASTKTQERIKRLDLKRLDVDESQLEKLKSRRLEELRAKIW
jgi:hypothetical protein